MSRLRDRPITASWHFSRLGWILLDLVLSVTAILLAYALQREFVFGWGTSNPRQPGAFQAALLYPWFVLLSAHIAGLHDPLTDRRRWLALLRVVISVVAALGFCLLVLYFVTLQQLGRTILLRTMALSIVLLGGGRLLVWQLASVSPRRVGCFLPQEAFNRFRNLVQGGRLPVELVAPKSDLDAGEPLRIAEYFRDCEVEEVVVALGHRRTDVWLACLNLGIQVTDMSIFVQREYYKVPCDDVDLAWFLGFDLKWNHPFYHRTKRVIDKVLAVFGLVLSAPLLLLAAAAILLETGRPIFYSQMRVGLQGRPYRIWKLRTMTHNAENKGAQWASVGDARVTRVGAILRRTRIDELPQLWNVFKGEMSLIGPRPERPEFVDQLATEIPLYPQRHWIPPGITGWAQINYPYGASVEDAREKLCYDLYYLKNASFFLDVHIALRTIGAIMNGSR